ncbi:MAG: CDP-glycerol glycerophosphotransferase family protein [Ancrocorticia sp.]|uniref:CDP-glycerol glycerophosphotransferase family protein n=1 Tax=Ancrocorticia sp. TaxID=2593684 RepID=UPI003F90650D
MNQEEEYLFAVSVIVAAYNSEQWVGVAMDSLLHQSIGLESLQIIIVDDGSTDSTGRIADEYAERYPTNIMVIHQENQGVGAARNAGISAAKGRYVGFLDSDDYLALDAVESVCNFFEVHDLECDLVAIPIELFGTRTGPHWNNRQRFRKSRVIDVTDQWNTQHLHAGGTFVKSDVLKSESIAFDPRLFISEDLTLINQIILRTLRYGVVSNTTYYYRRHEAGGSLVSSANLNDEYYTGVPRWSYQHLIHESLASYGHVPRYIQSVIAYDLSWRFRDAHFAVLSDSIQAEYLEILQEILKYVDDQVILAQKIAIEERLQILGFKHQTSILQAAENRQDVYYFNQIPIYRYKRQIRNMHRAPSCHITAFSWDGRDVQLSGVYKCMSFRGVTFGFVSGGKFIPAEVDSRAPLVREMLGVKVATGQRFQLRVSLGQGESITPAVRVRNGAQSNIYRIGLSMGRYTRFAGDSALGYYRRDKGSIFRQVGKSKIIHEELSFFGIMRRELGFMKRARSHGASWKVLGLRQLATARRALPHRETWLLGDRKLEAGDNAEALFRYARRSTRNDGVNAVFWLSPQSSDYRTLKKVGRVVKPNSLRFKLTYLRSTWFASSAADEFVLNPFGSDLRFVNDMRPAYQGFLQHGITKDDQSQWLNKWSKGFDLFVTSAERERLSILSDSYGYDPNEVVLTGMPRFDLLESSPEGRLLIAPTWRRQLVGELDPETGRNLPLEAFSDSEYFKFWQAVISDSRLNAVLAKNGMRGTFALHPSHAEEVGKFVPGPAFDISPYPHNYRDLFRTSDVLATDYSSVAFDFAYLRKPIVYIQTDRESFFASHLYNQGYFSYDDDGFGPVTSTYDETIDRLIEAIGFEGLAGPYAERVEHFFAFSDHSNSERVYTEMIDRAKNVQVRTNR